MNEEDRDTVVHLFLYAISIQRYINRWSLMRNKILFVNHVEGNPPTNDGIPFPGKTLLIIIVYGIRKNDVANNTCIHSKILVLLIISLRRLLHVPIRFTG